MILFFRAGETEPGSSFTISGNPVIVTLSRVMAGAYRSPVSLGECRYRMRELLSVDGSTWIMTEEPSQAERITRVSYNDQGGFNDGNKDAENESGSDDSGPRRSSLCRETGEEQKMLRSPWKLQHQCCRRQADHQLHEDKWADVGTKTYAMDGTADVRQRSILGV